MPLQAQTKSIPLYGGIDTKMDPKYVAWNQSISAQNVQYFGVNRVRKRYGQTAITQNIGSGGTQIAQGKALGVFNSELLEYDGSNLYAFATAQNAWFSRGALQEVHVNRTPIVRSSGSVNGVASAIAGALEAYAWEDTRGGVWYALRDPVSGTFAVPNSQLDAAGYNPSIVIIGTFVYIFYGSGSRIKAGRLSTTNPAGGIQTIYTLTTNHLANTSFGIASSGSQIIASWQSSSPSNTWSVGTFDTNLNQTNFSTFSFTAPANFIAQLAYSTDASKALLTVAGTTSVVLWPLNPSNATAGTSTTITTTNTLRGASVATGTATFQLFWDDNVWTLGNTGAVSKVVSATVTYPTSTTLTVGTNYPTYGLQLASQPVVYNSVPYFVGVSPLITIHNITSQQASFYLCSGSAGVAPVILQRFSGASAFVGGISFPLAAVTGANQLFLGLAERTQLRADAGGTIYTQNGVTAAYFTFPTVSSAQFTSFGTTCLMNCGNTWTYDGSTVVEQGFWEFPDGIQYAVTPGGNLNAGTYVYQVTYEWVDATGNTHYSAPSWPLTVTTSANNQVALTIPYTALTRKTGATVNIYRTATSPGNAGGTDTGLAPLYKVASVSNDPGLSGVSSFVYTDTAADATVAGNVPLYAPYDGSGELDNDPAPPFSFVVATKTRVFGIAQDDPTALWYSKPLSANRPADFSAAQVIRVETQGGAVTALAALDTQAVVFKQSRIYYLPGDGPNAAGTGTLFSALQLISSTTGCTSQPSVLSTSEGIAYQSALGLQLLNRSLSVNANFGLPVQSYNNLSITGAVAVPSQNQLRWATSAGTGLVYDYVTNRWCTYSNYDAVGYVPWNGTFARLRTTGQVLYEDTTTYLDNGASVQMLLETAWLKPADLAQGYAAVWYAQILGEYKSSHQLQVEIAYDYTDVPAQVARWNATANTNSSTFGSGATFGIEPLFGSNLFVFTTQYQVRIALQRQTCEAVKFKIYDVQATGQSCDLYEIALQLGVIGGLNRLPIRQQV